MAITKASSKTESWTIRIPIDLAEAARSKFPAETGNTQIVLESIMLLLGIDSNLSNNSSNTALQLQLDEIRSRLTALEQTKNSNESASLPEPTIPAVVKDWIDLAALATRLNFNPKSITNAINKRGEAIDDITIKFTIGGKTIYKKGSDRDAIYQIQ
jgi:hypothetical protein